MKTVCIAMSHDFRQLAQTKIGMAPIVLPLRPGILLRLALPLPFKNVVVFLCGVHIFSSISERGIFKAGGPYHDVPFLPYPFFISFHYDKQAPGMAEASLTTFSCKSLQNGTLATGIA